MRTDRDTRRGMKLGLACGVLLLPLVTGTVAWAQTEAVEVDPVRCWWRTSAGGVRVGEVFSIGLTCAVLENDSVQVQPDESRLAPAVISMAPFEMVGGEHPSDLRTANRRFFQYEYRLRLINPDAIGKDVRLPDLQLHYRLNSKVSANAALQGRDHMYLLPPLSVRVVSLVPADAPDIRDAAGESFSEAERFTFRAGALDIVAYTLIALGSLMVVLSAVRLVSRRRSRAPAEERLLGEGRVLGASSRELAALERDADEQGWNETLVGRALVATRIAAAVALDRPVNQRAVVGRHDGSTEGRLLTARRWRRAKRTAVSASVTADEVAQRLAKAPAADRADGQRVLEQLQSALAVFTASQYARNKTVDRGSLDRALASAREATKRLRVTRSWPKPQMRRWLGRTAEAD